ncbi:hypothetical protein MPH_01433 [Macrophomina phaseolina MS6]|uniref:AD domain-containing protein n=2 Tax=Macrophomina phaseolina TaxID=35725 RepID=K2RFD7_MACPH|nr:hypothetical protein MPH_01433 [Macrophomina phaseolina MS6]KAH7058723.1 anticodon-binding domain-containing protein [Macrophomina phaseolina]
MADGKRLSSAGKVATPKLGDQSILNDSHLFKAIGKRVKITTTLANHVLEGTIYAADPVLNAIAINTAPAPPNSSTNLASQPGNFHVVSIPNIQEFKVLPGEDGTTAGPDSFESAVPTIAALDLGALKAREEAAVRKLIEKDATRGRGVPKEAQEIFDAINRTLPTRWHEQTIIVNEAVMLGPPYTVNDLKAAEGKERNVEQIRKIMEGHAARKRQQQGGANKPGVATPIPPRKGG